MREVYKDLSPLKQPPPTATALDVKIISETAVLGNWMCVRPLLFRQNYCIYCRVWGKRREGLHARSV